MTDLLGLAKSAIRREKWLADLRAELLSHCLGLGTASPARIDQPGLFWQACIQLRSGSYCGVRVRVPDGEEPTSAATRADFVRRLLAWVDAGAVVTGAYTQIP